MASSTRQYGLATDSAEIPLVCLPYAGGGTSAFHSWRPALPQGIRLLPLTLPGHDGRLMESPRTNLCSLAKELTGELVAKLDRPFVLLGHSMGAWLAFEMARELHRTRAAMPVLLIVSANRPPHSEPTQPAIHELPDDEFLAELERRYENIPQTVRESRELLELLLPILRADVQMVETYQYADEPPLDVEILALGGTDDRAVSPAQLEGWRRHTTRACEIRLFPGGHFFLFGGSANNTVAARAPRPAADSPALQVIVDAIQRKRARGGTT